MLADAARWRPAADCPAPPLRRPPPAGPPCRAAGSAGCSCAAGNCSRRAKAPGPRTRPARQRCARMWSSNSWRKCRMVVSSGLGALWPRPHSEVSRIMRPISSRAVEIRFRGAAAREGVQDAQRFVQPHAARHALAAGFRMGELDEVAGHVHHAVVFIHHHHAARAHDGAELRQRLVIHRRVEHLVRNAAARRAAGLHGFDVLAVRSRLRPRRK